MARVGGRSAWFAWFIGVLALGAVAALVWLALPMMPSSLSWVGSAVAGGPAETGPSGDPSASGPVDDCRDLYPEALWSYLRQASGGDPVQDSSAPSSTATDFVASLAPEVRFTCTWTSDAGTVSSTVAAVGADAGAIAVSALPALGFTCDSPDGIRSGEVRCSRGDEAGSEQIDVVDGVWVSSFATGWQPERYASRVAEQVLGREG